MYPIVRISLDRIVVGLKGVIFMCHSFFSLVSFDIGGQTPIQDTRDDEVFHEVVAVNYSENE